MYGSRHPLNLAQANTLRVRRSCPHRTRGSKSDIRPACEPQELGLLVAN